MKLTIVCLTIYVTLALVTHKTNTVDGHVLDLPPEFLHDTASNILEMEALAAMGKGRSGVVLDLDSSGTRRSHQCNVEINTRIPGKCKFMGRAGVACIAGEYMDLVNADCMM